MGKGKVIGFGIRKIWQDTAQRNGLEISINGLPALSSYSIISDKSMAYKTYITQEFLKRGYLAGTILYASSAHDHDRFSEYEEILDKIYCTISECENGRDIEKLLEGPICHSGFKRLN